MKKGNGFFRMLILGGMVMLAADAFSHCEVPCGIYEDSLRIEMMKEHILTIEKGMKKIEELSKETPVNFNQVVRWINNKDEHANLLQDIVEQYFMRQRIVPVEEKEVEKYKKYVGMLSLLHQIQVYAVKAKQTTDLQYVEKMRTALSAFTEAYFHKH